MLAAALGPLAGAGAGSEPPPSVFHELGDHGTWRAVSGPGGDWQPPGGFGARPGVALKERPAKGQVMLFGLLADESFGPNPIAEVEMPRGKRAELIQAFVVNVGAAPWTGRLRIDIPEAGIAHETKIKALKPNRIGVSLWAGYLVADSDTLTVTATALEGDRVVDRMTKRATYHRDWPTTFPVGLYVRDLDAPSAWPAWLPGRPYAVSLLNTSPLGTNHIITCDERGCEDWWGAFYAGPFRAATIAGFARGQGCLTTHVDYLGTAVWPHDRVDDRECLPA